MYGFTKWVSIVATTAWLTLGVLTAGSGFLEKNTVTVNFVFAALFLCVALFLFWRLSVMALVVRSAPENTALKFLFRVEAVNASAMLLLGLFLLTAAGTRVFGERLPIFG